MAIEQLSTNKTKSMVTPIYGEGISGYTMDFTVQQAMFLTDIYHRIGEAMHGNLNNREDSLIEIAHRLEGFLEQFKNIPTINDEGIWEVQD